MITVIRFVIMMTTIILSSSVILVLAAFFFRLEDSESSGLLGFASSPSLEEALPRTRHPAASIRMCVPWVQGFMGFR